jgi:general secretion pathway protein C
MRTALAVVLGTGVVGANVASVLVSYWSARESTKAALSVDTTLAAITRRLPPPGGTARAASPTPPVAAPPSAEALPWNGIFQMSDREFLVDAKMANDVLEGEPAWFLRSIRIAPGQQRVGDVGIRLFGVTPHSLLGRLGIENGDRIETINGYEMTNPENALSAYESLRRKNDFLVTLNRHGQSLTLHYRVV